MFFQRFPIAHVLWAQEVPCVLSLSIYSGDVCEYLLRGGDGTSVKKLDEDLDILWASKGGNVDLSKWSKDDFSTGLIPDYTYCKYFAGKPVVTNNFGLCFAAKEKFYQHFLATTFFHLATEKKFQLSVGACWKKLISDPESIHSKVHI